MITATSVVDGITSASSALTVVRPSESAQQQRRRLQFRVLTGVGFACPQDSLAQCATGVYIEPHLRRVFQRRC
jgi:hypothetical protein